MLMYIIGCMQPICEKKKVCARPPCWVGPLPSRRSGAVWPCMCIRQSSYTPKKGSPERGRRCYNWACLRVGTTVVPWLPGQRLVEGQGWFYSPQANQVPWPAWRQRRPILLRCRPHPAGVKELSTLQRALCTRGEEGTKKGSRRDYTAVVSVSQDAGWGPSELQP